MVHSMASIGIDSGIFRVMEYLIDLVAAGSIVLIFVDNVLYSIANGKTRKM